MKEKSASLSATETKGKPQEKQVLQESPEEIGIPPSYTPIYPPLPRLAPEESNSNDNEPRPGLKKKNKNYCHRRSRRKVRMIKPATSSLAMPGFYRCLPGKLRDPSITMNMARFKGREKEPLLWLTRRKHLNKSKKP